MLDASLVLVEVVIPVRRVSLLFFWNYSCHCDRLEVDEDIDETGIDRAAIILNLGKNLFPFFILYTNDERIVPF